MTTKNLRRIEPTETCITQGIVKCSKYIKIPDFPNFTAYDFLVGFPNAGKRRTLLTQKGKMFCVEGKRLVAEGMKKGASDLFFAFPVFITNEYGDTEKDDPGLWMEVKKPGGKLSKEQELWFKKMRMVGFPCVKVEAIDEGIQAIKDYLGMR